MNKNNVQKNNVNTENLPNQVIKNMTREGIEKITKVFSHDGKELNALTSILENMYENAPHYEVNDNGFNALHDKGMASEGETKRFYNVAFGMYSTLKKNANLGYSSLANVEVQKPKTKQLVIMDRNINKFNTEESVINFVAYLHIWIVSIVGISINKISVDSKGRFNQKAKGYFADFGIEFTQIQNSVLGYMPNVLSDEFEAPKHLVNFYKNVAKDNNLLLSDLATEFEKSESVKANKISKKKAKGGNSDKNQIMVAMNLKSEGQFLYFNSKDSTKLINEGFIRNIDDAKSLSNDLIKFFGLSGLKVETKGHALGSIIINNQDVTKLTNK